MLNASQNNKNSGRLPFMGVRNLVKMHQQRDALCGIIDRADDLMKASTVNESSVNELELRSIIKSATFMMSTISYLLVGANRAELEHPDVVEIISRAETMTAIMSSAIH